MAELTETRTVERAGVKLAVDVGGSGPPVVLAHGFPELAYSWRHQVPALIHAGYRVAVPDQRGYGRSDRPEQIEAYDIVELTDDLLAVLDSIGEDRAVFVGHDWGAQVVWQLALLAPERVAGVVGLSVPFLPRGPVPTVTLLRQIYADNFFYMLYFQEPGVADAELAADPAKTMRRMLGGATPGQLSQEQLEALAAPGSSGLLDRMPEPTALPHWLSQSDLDHYVETFTRTGFTGGLNWYRNLDRDWELTARIDGAHVRCPSMFIAGSADVVLTFTTPEAGLPFLDDHRSSLILAGAGHWVQQERPAEVNAAVISFLDDVTHRKAHP
jgi:pimeloyl-ACP methyl ester carboxylesterase